MPSSSATSRIDRKSTRLNSSHTVIYTLSLHDALPIYHLDRVVPTEIGRHPVHDEEPADGQLDAELLSDLADRSEEHTSELQSHSDLHSFPTRRSSDLSSRSRRPNRDRAASSPRRGACRRPTRCRAPQRPRG